MDLHFSSTKKQQVSKLNRKRLTPDQARLLETCFNANQKLQVDCKLKLACRLGLPPRQVAVWYQNRRAREKVHTIELDIKTIHKELDTVLAENRRHEQEVDMLKHELNKVQKMLLASTSSATLQPLVSISDDNNGNSSTLHGKMTRSWEDAGPLPLEELYSSFIGHSEKQCRTDLSFQSVISSGMK